jgi:hypothetical protein
VVFEVFEPLQIPATRCRCCNAMQRAQPHGSTQCLRSHIAHM